MSLIPVFKIGLWNAWIFMLYHFLPTPIIMIIHKDTTEKGYDVPHSEIEKKLHPIIWIVWILTFIYSIFLPLQIGTIWFYIGIPISLIGLIGYTMVIITFATTPIEHEPLTKGLYRYSRHPTYITQLVMFLGASIASASWLFLLLSVIYSILMFIIAIPEERFCLEKYGNAYREYLKRTQRWIGIPKS